MCPACITSVLLMTIGASSTGGLLAVGLKKLLRQSKRNQQTHDTAAF
jgi:hypothetical protein